MLNYAKRCGKYRGEMVWDNKTGNPILLHLIQNDFYKMFVRMSQDFTRYF